MPHMTRVKAVSVLPAALMPPPRRRGRPPPRRTADQAGRHDRRPRRGRLPHHRRQPGEDGGRPPLGRTDRPPTADPAELERLGICVDHDPRTTSEHTGATAKAACSKVFTGIVADTDGTPQHCTAGKDRTGRADATLLTAPGVPRETVTTEHLSSDACRAAVNAAALAAMPATQAAVHKPMLDVHPELQAAVGRHTAEDPVGRPPCVEHPDGAGLDDAGALTLCHIRARPAFQHDAVDTAAPRRRSRLATVRAAGPAPITTTVADSAGIDDSVDSPSFAAA
ncbi:tyrosine-protein phosphatase [Streptomyces sp. NPDC001443]